MRTVTHTGIESKHVVFEPGNATRYNLVLSKIHGECYIISDLNNHKTILLNPDHFSATGIEMKLVEHGYSHGDAQPMAEFINEALREIYYVEYEVRKAKSVEYKTEWFKEHEDMVQWILDGKMDAERNVKYMGQMWDNRN